MYTSILLYEKPWVLLVKVYQRIALRDFGFELRHICQLKNMNAYFHHLQFRKLLCGQGREESLGLHKWGTNFLLLRQNFLKLLLSETSLYYTLKNSKSLYDINCIKNEHQQICRIFTKSCKNNIKALDMKISKFFMETFILLTNEK